MMKVVRETLKGYYQRTNQPVPPELQGDDQNVSHFNVQKRICQNRIPVHYRRDYYRICLSEGTGIYTVKDEEVQVQQAAIIFFNPAVASSWHSVSEQQMGHFCLFNDAFLQNTIRQDLKYASPLFNPSGKGIILLSGEEMKRLEHYFLEMKALQASDYAYRFDMIRTLLQLLIHEGVRLQSAIMHNAVASHPDRIATGFLHLLSQQFPVDSPENPLRLMTPAEYAVRLNVHVNHLNAVVKKHTDKTTRDVIRERIVDEAKTLLRNTDWDAAEIAYSLGFEYPSHFNKYFKQYTGLTPLAFRQVRHI
jgi:AraC family transcriptional regulator, transcriptional activator of pobA